MPEQSLQEMGDRRYEVSDTAYVLQDLLWAAESVCTILEALDAPDAEQPDDLDGYHEGMVVFAKSIREYLATHQSEYDVSPYAPRIPLHHGMNQLLGQLYLWTTELENAMWRVTENVLFRTLFAFGSCDALYALCQCDRGPVRTLRAIAHKEWRNSWRFQDER